VSSLHTLIWRQEGHPVSKNKSLQTFPNNESQDLIGGNHPTHAHGKTDVKTIMMMMMMTVLATTILLVAASA